MMACSLAYGYTYIHSPRLLPGRKKMSRKQPTAWTLNISQKQAGYEARVHCHIIAIICSASGENYRACSTDYCTMPKCAANVYVYLHQAHAVSQDFCQVFVQNIQMPPLSVALQLVADLNTVCRIKILK